MMHIQTVTGPFPAADVQLADAHAHAWIAPPPDVAPEARFDLHDPAAITAELRDFRAAGGTLLVDCQPAGCGRDANQLRKLSQQTGLQITAVTGFHRRRYYSPGSWLWQATAEQAAAYFISELTVSVAETNAAGESPVHAAAVKIGYEGTLEGQTRILIEAAAEATRQTGALLLVHTERGANVESLQPFLLDRGISSSRLYFCHMDKRPDVGLHRELARAGVLLGYDTFARPHEVAVWPLLHQMLADGYSAHIALGLDLARASMWQHYGGQPGLLLLPQQVLPRLHREGFSQATIRRITAQNMASRLVWQSAW